MSENQKVGTPEEVPAKGAQEKRIAKVFGLKGVPLVNKETLRAYARFLEENLDRPCWLNGIEDFPWEEFFVWGPGSAAEYARLRKTQPSYRDDLDLIEIERELDPDHGLLAKVRRASDGKTFHLPLEDLKAKDRRSRNRQLLWDHAVWSVNYR
ncbi:MAG: hypothetical protein HY608_04060 [Planctomycetes bacterium]|nr:hypothetical protein [Planctomycetota bacterium]